MILKVFAVRDMKAQAFLQPFYSPSIGSAVRAFSDAVNDKSCPFNKHPEDYVLYEIGIYDDSTSNLSSVNPITMLGCASDFIELKPKFGDVVGDLQIAEDVAKEIKSGKK